MPTHFHLFSEMIDTMDAGAPGGRQLNTKGPILEKLEVQTSEACLRSFIIFDQTASKRTMILHPDLLNGHSSLVPDIASDTTEPFGHLQGISDKAVETMLNVHSLAHPTIKGATSAAYRKTMESSFAAFQKIKTDSFYFSSSKAGDSLTACLSAVEKALDKSKETAKDVNQGCCERAPSQLNEDTEDIDALLSSDDELSSTGHSPCEADLDNVTMYSDNRKNNNSSIPIKKRKFAQCDTEEADEDFGSDEADSGEVLVNNCEDKIKNVSDLAIRSWDLHSPREELSNEDFQCRGMTTNLLQQLSFRQKQQMWQNPGFVGDSWVCEKGRSK